MNIYLHELKAKLEIGADLVGFHHRIDVRIYVHLFRLCRRSGVDQSNDE